MAKRIDPNRRFSPSQKLLIGQWALIVSQFLLILWQAIHR